MQKKFVIALCLCMCCLVGVTVAWLTSTTGEVKNIFTVGDVEITLDEAVVDVYGVDQGTRTTTGNTYKLIPGHSYVKDPKVYVNSISEPCYVFVEVVNNISAIESKDTDYVTIAKQMENLGWTRIDGTDIYYYNTVVDPTAANADLTLEVFANFKIADDANVSEYATTDTNKSYITIKAYAVQKDGFNDAVSAWNEAFGS